MRDTPEPAVAVAVMAKEPALGTVKTRLAGVLGERDRLGLYRAFLADRLAQISSLPGVAPWIAFSPEGAEPAFAGVAGPGFGLLAQRGADLGERLHHAAEDLLARGYASVLLVDSDTPSLPPEHLVEAARALDPRRARAGPRPELVLGPAWDGGYYLVGLSRPLPEIFRGIDWSTPRVLGQTVAAAQAAGLSIHFLPSWYDVDTPADLARLQRDLERTPRDRPGYPVRTAEILAALPIAPAPAPRPRDEGFRTLSTRPAYQNRWLDVTESVVELEPGRLTLYGVVTCGPCVGVLPLLDGGRVLLVRQFRYVARRATWEIPTGGVHPGEGLEEAAQRELAEECGYAARRLTHLATYHTSKSVVDEVAHVYLGEGLERAPRPPDDTERIDVRATAFGEALGMVLSGEIVDSMSVIALLAADRRLRGA
jgi:rSAM/selenodomain-associated transferase 1